MEQNKFYNFRLDSENHNICRRVSYNLALNGTKNKLYIKVTHSIVIISYSWISWADTHQLFSQRYSGNPHICRAANIQCRPYNQKKKMKFISSIKWKIMSGLESEDTIPESSRSIFLGNSSSCNCILFCAGMRKETCSYLSTQREKAKQYPNSKFV